jgi:hypothetical protein
MTLPPSRPEARSQRAEWKHLVEVIDVIQDVPREVCGERVDILAALSERDWVKLKKDRWGSELASRWAAPRKTAGSLPSELRKISWICNLFAVPRADAAVRWWAAVSGQVRQRLAMRPKNSFN